MNIEEIIQFIKTNCNIDDNVKLKLTSLQVKNNGYNIYIEIEKPIFTMID